MIEVKEYAPVVIVDGHRVWLTPMEHAIVRYLRAHAGTPVTRQQLLRDVWDYAVPIETRAIDTHISRLTRKTRALPIYNVRDVGYIWTQRPGD